VRETQRLVSAQGPYNVISQSESLQSDDFISISQVAANANAIQLDYKAEHVVWRWAIFELQRRLSRFHADPSNCQRNPVNSLRSAGNNYGRRCVPRLRVKGLLLRSPHPFSHTIGGATLPNLITQLICQSTFRKITKRYPSMRSACRWNTKLRDPVTHCES